MGRPVVVYERDEPVVLLIQIFRKFFEKRFRSRLPLSIS